VSLSSDGEIVAIGNFRRVLFYRWNTSASIWNQMGAVIYRNNKVGGGEYCGSVSLSSNGEIVAIGEALKSNGNSERVRVFRWNTSASNWNQMGTDIEDYTGDDDSGKSCASLDCSGSSVSLSSNGETVAIRSNGNDYYNGLVRVFGWNNSTLLWHQMGADVDGEADYDYSGSAVSLSSNGEVVAIGAVKSNDDYRGLVRVFRWNPSTLVWYQMGADIRGKADYDYFGIAMSLSSDGEIVAIGAVNAGADSNDDAYNYPSGNVRVFKWKQSV